jgi:SET domain-containing protein
MMPGNEGSIPAYLVLKPMNLLNQYLYVKRSILPNAGYGLFTTIPIEKGRFIIEYIGEVTTWEAIKGDWSNHYIYFVNEEHVINAKAFPDALARYVNDARGLTRVRGVPNNSVFVNLEGKVYIKATKNIPAETEILVSYGKNYWEAIRKNRQMDNLKR